MLFTTVCLDTFAQGTDNSTKSSNGRTRAKVKKTPKYNFEKPFINLPSYDERVVHYGFFLALNNSTFKVNPSLRMAKQVLNPSLRPDDSTVLAINPNSIPGFTTGFILNIRLGENFDFRFLPTVSFYTRWLEFRTRDEKINLQLSKSTFSFLEFPMLLKFKSQRRGNYRMYMVGGIKPAVEVGAKREELGPDDLRTNTYDFSIDYGFGLDYYYPLFKFSPEIRFSHGYTNMLYPDYTKNNIYAQNLDGFYTHTVTLYFHFE